MKKRRIEYITWQQMNEHLEYCYNFRKIVEDDPEKYKLLGTLAVVENRLVYFTLTYARGKTVTTYQCRKDDQDGTQFTNGMEAYAILQRYYKCPDLRTDPRISKGLLFDSSAGKFLLTARPLLYCNPKYNNTRNEAIGYDINSSYSYAMLNDMPDTSVPYRTGYVKDGEMGFKEDSEGNFVPVFTGHFAIWIFPIMPTPFKRFVDKYYEKKLNSTSIEEKLKAKGILNYCIGYMQRTNPFLRAAIIYYANKKIADLIDENTLYCNTDAIVSLKPLDLDIGPKIGQFKVEHQGKFAYNGYNYQWDNEKPSYRHISKAWFKPNFDILVDKPPKAGNLVEYKDFKLREIDYDSQIKPESIKKSRKVQE